VEERVRLWHSIQGRDQSSELDVLRIRTAICVLHQMDAEDTSDTLEYFLAFWQRGGLGMEELKAAIENKYGMFPKP
jgi:hypothetical protein